MSRVTHGDVTAHSMELVAITIPGSGDDGETVDALKTVKDYDARIFAWEIVENALAFEVGKAADMAAPVITADADEGFAPPVSAAALSELWLRSATAATVAATLILYTAKEDVITV